MLFRKNKDINLSESVVVAMESLRLALEVWYGYQVHFIGPMVIIPSTRRDWKLQYRNIGIEIKFRQPGVVPDSYTSIKKCVAIGVELIKPTEMDESYWRTERIHFSIENVKGERSWFWAHFEGSPIYPTVRVAMEIGNPDDRQHWRIGHGIADRHLKPIY